MEIGKNEIMQFMDNINFTWIKIEPITFTANNIQRGQEPKQLTS